MKEIFLVLSLMFFMFSLSILAMNHLSRVSCERYGKITDRQVKYENLGGCFVKMDNGKYVHQDQLREVL